MELSPESFTNDYVIEYLEKYKTTYSRFRDAYNVHAVQLKNRHNFITFPLLVITSATGVIAGLDSLPRTAGVVVGAASAVLTAIQRYCAYAERSENARMTAKSYSKIINKIQAVKLAMKSKVLENMSKDMFANLIREIQGLSNSTRENALEMPWELLKYIDTIDAQVCCFPVVGVNGKKQVVDASTEIETLPEEPV